jgi:hypothetical protein
VQRHDPVAVRPDANHGDILRDLAAEGVEGGGVRRLDGGAGGIEPHVRIEEQRLARQPAAERAGAVAPLVPGEQVRVLRAKTIAEEPRHRRRNRVIVALGGDVLAQALRAAGELVPAEGLPAAIYLE